MLFRIWIGQRNKWSGDFDKTYKSVDDAEYAALSVGRDAYLHRMYKVFRVCEKDTYAFYPDPCLLTWRLWYENLRPEINSVISGWNDEESSTLDLYKTEAEALRACELYGRHTHGYQHTFTLMPKQVYKNSPNETFDVDHPENEVLFRLSTRIGWYSSTLYSYVAAIQRSDSDVFLVPVLRVNPNVPMFSLLDQYAASAGSNYVYRVALNCDQETRQWVNNEVYPTYSDALYVMRIHKGHKNKGIIKVHAENINKEVDSPEHCWRIQIKNGGNVRFMAGSYTRKDSAERRLSKISLEPGETACVKRVFFVDPETEAPLEGPYIRYKIIPKDAGKYGTPTVNTLAEAFVWCRLNNLKPDQVTIVPIETEK